MKKAFTLVELLVVIAILGVLMGVLVVSFGGSFETARAAKCQSNMVLLAKACSSQAMEDSERRFPHAGSAEYVTLRRNSNTGKYKKVYGENRGWLSWLSKGAFDNSPSSFVSCQMPGIYSEQEDIQHAYTNGAIWRAVSGNADCFKCPTMIKALRESSKFKRQKTEPAWTYVMSSRFGYDSSHGSEATEVAESGLKMSALPRADRTLMFAEMNIDDLQSGTTGDRTGDCVLEYDDGSGDSKKERIGFPHNAGRRGYAGYVAFADGHVEQIFMPDSQSEQQELTKWLCQGYDVRYVNGKYEYIKESIEDQ